MTSFLEATLAQHIRAKKLPKPELEYRFHPTRKWRFDFCFVAERLAVEVEGGVWTGGRHSTGPGFTKDCEKYAQAAILGYRVIRVTGAQVEDGQAITWIEQALEWKIAEREGASR